MLRSRSAHRFLAVVMVPALVALLLGACSGGTAETSTSLVPGSAPGGRVDLVQEPEGPPRKGGTAVFGLAAETDGWNPATNRWSTSGYIVGLSVYDPLAAYDDQLAPRPYLARSFSSNADFTEWTIELRPNIVFHDGSPVDAAAVAQNLEAQKASGLTSEAFSFVQSISVTGQSQVVVSMSRPWSGFPNMLTSQVGAIASPATLTGGAEGSRHPVGSGPFRFGDWQTGKSLTMARNERYWRTGYPHLDGLEFRVLSDGASRGQALHSGDVDIVETAEPAQIVEFTAEAQKPDAKFQIFTDLKTDGPKIFMPLNHAAPPFDDPLARDAVDAAVDRQKLSDIVYAGVFPPARGPFSEASAFFAPDAVGAGYDPARAKSLADQYAAKHGGPLTFTLTLPATTESATLGQVLQQQLAEVGITVAIASEEQVTLIVDVIAGKYEAAIWALFASPVIDTTYVFFASPAKPVGQLSLNFARVTPEDNAALVAAMDKARTTLDPAEQKIQYAIVQKEMARTVPFVFLVRQTTAVIFKSTLHGAKTYDLPGPQGEPAGHALSRTAPLTFNLWVEP